MNIGSFAYRSGLATSGRSPLRRRQAPRLVQAVAAGIGCLPKSILPVFRFRRARKESVIRSTTGAGGLGFRRRLGLLPVIGEAGSLFHRPRKLWLWLISPCAQTCDAGKGGWHFVAFHRSARVSASLSSALNRKISQHARRNPACRPWSAIASGIASSASSSRRRSFPTGIAAAGGSRVGLCAGCLRRCLPSSSQFFQAIRAIASKFLKVSPVTVKYRSRS